MKRSLSRYWNLFWHFRNLEFMRLLHNRTEFVFWTIISTMWAVMNMVSIGLYTNINGQLAGWKPAEVYVLLSFYAILDTVIWDWIEPNMAEYHRLVNSGELSSLLMKPINAQWMLMTHKNNYNNLTRLVLGLVSLIYWIHVLQLPITLMTIISFVILFLGSASFVYGLWFLCTTFSLWTDRLANINEVLPNLRQFWQVPSGVYQGMASFILTFVLPISLITTVPAESVLGRSHWQTQAVLLLSSAIVLVVGRLFFKRSVREFSGAGG